MSAKQPTPPPKGDYMPNRPTSPPPPKRRAGSLSNAMTDLIMQHERTIDSLRKRIAKAIEAAQVQARWPSGEFVEIVEAKALDLIVEILEGKQ